MKYEIIFIILVGITLSSCGTTLKISNDAGCVEGLPFYSHKAVVFQETKYLYTWLKVSLIKQVEFDSTEKVDVIPLIEKRINIVDYDKYQKLVKDFYNSKDETEAFNVVDAELKKMDIARPKSSDISANNLIENKYDIKHVVDYSTKYYLNSNLPLFGNSTLHPKLASNGTLTEVSSTVDTQLDDLVTGLVGLATPLTSIKVAKIENDKDVVGVKEGEFLMGSQSILKLLIEEEGFLYNFKKNHHLDSLNNAKEPIIFNLKSGNFSRVNWPIQETVPEDAVDDTGTETDEKEN